MCTANDSVHIHQIEWQKNKIEKSSDDDNRKMSDKHIYTPIYEMGMVLAWLHLFHAHCSYAMEPNGQRANPSARNENAYAFLHYILMYCIWFFSLLLFASDWNIETRCNGTCDRVAAAAAAVVAAAVSSNNQQKQLWNRKTYDLCMINTGTKCILMVVVFVFAVVAFV